MSLLAAIETMRLYTGKQDLQEIDAYMSICVFIRMCLQSAS